MDSSVYTECSVWGTKNTKILVLHTNEDTAMNTWFYFWWWINPKSHTLDLSDLKPSSACGETEAWSRRYSIHSAEMFWQDCRVSEETDRPTSPRGPAQPGQRHHNSPAYFASDRICRKHFAYYSQRKIASHSHSVFLIRPQKQLDAP